MRLPNMTNSSADREFLQEFRDEQKQFLEAIHIRSIQIYDLLAARTARPYYPLSDGWALTHLDTGEPFFVNTRDRHVTPWIVMGGTWEDNVWRVLRAYIEPGMNVVDIGAHCGYYTIKMGMRVGAGRVTSFEPNPEMNIFCERNVMLNGLIFKITLHKLALSDRIGTARLTFQAGDETQASIVGGSNGDRSYEVDMNTLDNTMAGAAAIDLIKIDAEGSEYPILEGAAETLSRSPNCAIMLELSRKRWMEYGPIEDVARLIGDKEIFSVGAADGSLRRIAIEDIGQFLNTCAFHENYFFFCPRQEASLNKLESLIAA